jgi:hypothetical protein
VAGAAQGLGVGGLPGVGDLGAALLDVGGELDHEGAARAGLGSGAVKRRYSRAGMPLALVPRLSM